MNMSTNFDVQLFWSCYKHQDFTHTSVEEEAKVRRIR